MPHFFYSFLLPVPPPPPFRPLTPILKEGSWLHEARQYLLGQLFETIVVVPGSGETQAEDIARTQRDIHSITGFRICFFCDIFICHFDLGFILGLLFIIICFSRLSPSFVPSPLPLPLSPSSSALVSSGALKTLKLPLTSRRGVFYFIYLFVCCC